MILFASQILSNGSIRIFKELLEEILLHMLRLFLILFRVFVPHNTSSCIANKYIANITIYEYRKPLEKLLTICFKNLSLVVTLKALIELL